MIGRLLTYDRGILQGDSASFPVTIVCYIISWYLGYSMGGTRFGVIWVEWYLGRSVDY